MIDMEETPIPPDHRRGRGATANKTGRFDNQVTIPVDDGWGDRSLKRKELPTRVTIERPVRILTRNNSPDVPFDRSINAYRGCEHVIHPTFLYSSSDA